jgi:hypothetical protein
MKISNSENNNKENNNKQETHKKIIHDIRNMKRLSKQNITDIEEMSHKQKMEIILTYDKLIGVFDFFLDGKK